jgi:hypothetical protein
LLSFVLFDFSRRHGLTATLSMNGDFTSKFGASSTVVLNLPRIGSAESSIFLLLSPIFEHIFWIQTRARHARLAEKIWRRRTAPPVNFV